MYVRVDDLRGSFGLMGTGAGLMHVTFFGVRGSTPCAGDTNARYGGNTTSVVVEVAGAPPILLDLGTGLRYFGETCPAEGAMQAIALVTHLHWDHVQGLPFFGPILRPGSGLEVFAPRPGLGLTLAEAFQQGIRPPYFPVHLTDLFGEFTFHEVDRDRFDVGPVTVTTRPVPHVGPTAGYRLSCGGRSLAFIPDHQQPADGSFDVTEEVLELADGVDLLIHDAQYTLEEFAAKLDWGHSTAEYAVEVARRAGAKSVALFHHDPSHSDDTIDCMAAAARLCAARFGIEVIAAHEGLTVTLEPR